MCSIHDHDHESNRRLGRKDTLFTLRCWTVTLGAEESGAGRMGILKHVMHRCEHQGTSGSRGIDTG